MIPVNIQSNNPGLWDLASLQMQQRQIRQAKQQQAQQQIMNVITTLGQFVMQQKEKKKAEAEIEKYKKAGYDIKWVIDPITGERKASIERRQNITEQLSGLFPFLPQMILQQQGQINMPQGIGEPSVEEIQAELLRRKQTR